MKYNMAQQTIENKSGPQQKRDLLKKKNDYNQ